MGGARRRIIPLIGTALVAGIIVTGCSSGAKDSASAGSAGLSQPQAGTLDQKQANEAAPPAQGKDAPAEAPDLSIDQRSIIYTGSITIRVDDVNQAAARATAIADGAGGFVGGDKRDTGAGSADATMVLRIPAEKFSSVVEQLAHLPGGKEEQRGISTEDVTEQTVDLDARISVQQARVNSGRNLLAKAKTLSDLVMLEREVATRESDLASLQAKKRRLADLTALSTITVVLLTPTAKATPKKEAQHGFLAGLKGGWKALTGSLTVLLAVLGALLPWLIAIGLPAWAIYSVSRRYVRRRPGPLVLAPGTADPTGPPPRE